MRINKVVSQDIHVEVDIDIDDIIAELRRSAARQEHFDIVPLTRLLNTFIGVINRLPDHVVEQLTPSARMQLSVWHDLQSKRFAPDTPQQPAESIDTNYGGTE